MIAFLAWKSEKSGLGHSFRTRKLFSFIKKIYKCDYCEFRNLNELYKILNKTKAKIIFLDTYIISKKISLFLKKKFKKVIIRNDYQFKLEKFFFYFDDFKYHKKKLLNNTSFYYGQKYCIPKNLIKKKKDKNQIILIIFNNIKQRYFFNIVTHLLKNKKEFKKIFINVRNKKIKKEISSIENAKTYGFIKNNEIALIANNSDIIISPVGQTMMSLLEDNNYPNVISISKNQDYYSKILNKNNQINLINKKNSVLKKNIINKYISFTSNENLSRKIQLTNIFKFNG